MRRSTARIHTVLILASIMLITFAWAWAESWSAEPFASLAQWSLVLLTISLIVR